ncbi:interleukin-1 receptor-associated kinase 4-like [Plodia interpunctella]|uniref:interleukin-1 receptor-associated kinase 4-like n=1 Tax=Plodia interpunctella TaxID=58824 RepID=UPI00236845AE|nr:interleukin-1 receptor-associated kinase 4-like [Plodia interpunctella]
MELQVNQDVELRKLSTAPLCRIADILETNSDWKKVMSLITKHPLDKSSGPKYNNEHMRLIEEHAKATGKKCAEVLFDEWGTSGRVRPTLRILKELIQKAEIYRAADVIAEILNEPAPLRPMKGPAAAVPGITILLNDLNMENEHTIGPNKIHMNHYYNQDQPYNVTPNINNDTTVQMLSSANIPIVIESIGNKSTHKLESVPDMIKFSESMNLPDFSALIPKSSTQSDTNLSIPVLNVQKSPDLSRIDNSILKSTDLVHFEYKDLETITYKFFDRLFTSQFGPTGRIGSGGFGEVYVGYHPSYGHVAVKRIRDINIEEKPDVAMKTFNSEVKSLLHLRHVNIVPIIGYSIDGPALCLVCEFVEGGSLEQNLAAKRLNQAQRVAIMVGTAEGLKYIHQTERLVGSEEKINSGSEHSSTKKNYFMHGDVKSANILLTKDCVPKLCDFGLAKNIDHTVFTTTLMGTHAYMAPEGFSGTVTQKIDIYSFGIVLLELITGLRPIIVEAKMNIKDYVEENCKGDINRLLDPVVKDWEKANEVYELALKCLKRDRSDRPTMDIVCDNLKNIFK